MRSQLRGSRQVTVEVPELFAGGKPPEEPEVLVKVVGPGSRFSTPATSLAAEPEAVRGLKSVVTGPNGQGRGHLQKKKSVIIL